MPSNFFTLEDIVGLLDIIVTLFLGLVGLYLTHNFRRQVKQKTADGRMKSYSELWEITGLARPTRTKAWHAEELKGPLTPDERRNLYIDLTRWYYQNGNGMFLGDTTRRMYLITKDNLICPDEALDPPKLYEILEQLPEEKRIEQRGHFSIRQLSLLRARMRADLEVYGVLYIGELRDEDKLFLKRCGEDWRKKPWSGQRGGERGDE